MDADQPHLVSPQEVVLKPPAKLTDRENGVKPKKTGCFIFVLEPVVFLMFLAMSLQGAVFQNQLLYQSCTNVFHFNETECKILGMEKGNNETKEIEIIVQTYAAKILMASQLIDSFVPATCSLFIGPWSDKFGRKPVILASLLGYVLCYSVKSLIVFISSFYVVNPWLYILSSIPAAILGGNCGLIVGVMCYITDVALPKERAYRMVFIEGSIYIGLMIGSLACSHLLIATNVLTIFCLASFLALLAVTYVLFLVDESVKPEQLETESKIRGLFKLALVKDMIFTCFERRPNYDRAIIWLCMVVLALNVFAMDGNATVCYLFVMEKFGWTLSEYTNYDAIGIVVLIIGNIIGMYILQKLFNFSITSLALIAMGSQVLDAVVKAFATYSWELYLSVTLGFFKSITGPMVRTILSHVTPLSDIGKIMSFTTSLESLTPLGAAPLYTLVYSATIRYDPGFYNVISIIVYFVCYICLAIIFGIKKSYGNTSAYAAIGN